MDTLNPDKMKENYISPLFKATKVELEDSIAAGSAVVDPRPSDGQVQQQWTQDDDQNYHFDWGNQ